MQFSNMKKYDKNAYLFITDGLRDSSWEISKSIPLVNKFVDHTSKNKVNVLDVRGGAELILKTQSRYIEERDMEVNKFTLDPSYDLLQVQKENDPDLKRALNEEIRKTSLGTKEINLTLMIKVLEHMPNPIEALEEPKRFSKFVIFKVTLEDCLFVRKSNFVTRGKLRQHYIETLGHINILNFSALRRQIEKHLGQILNYYFTSARARIIFQGLA